MKKKDYILVVFILLVELFIAPAIAADSKQNREYQVKAAFIYNFTKFIDWPENKATNGNELITIGIIGKDPFKKAFEPIKSKQSNGKIALKHFDSFTKLKKAETLKKCHILFICSSEKNNLKNILTVLKDSSVLTIADTKGFLEAGVIINFVIEEKKVGFEVNLAIANKAGLKIRSRLLRLAKKIINKE